LLLADLIYRNARYYPEKVALISGTERMTFSEFGSKVNQFANALQALGLNRGDRVAVLLRNCPSQLVAFFGTLKAGLVVVPVNFRLKAPEIVYILNDCGARVIVFGKEFAASIEENKAAFATIEHYICMNDEDGNYITFSTFIDQQSTAEAPNQEESRDNDLCFILYTAGTAGFPKGVMLSHSNLLSNAINTIVTLASPRFEDVYLMVLPLFHAAALGVEIRLLVAGASQVLHESFDPARTLQTIQDEHISWVSFVPTMIVGLLQVPDLSSYDLSSLRIISYGTAPISPVLLQQMMTAFHCEFNQGFGQTEHSPAISYLTSADHVMDAPEKEILLKSVGRPIFNVHVRIVDGNDNDVNVGQTGEIIVKSESVMQGYWNKPGLTAEALKNGWLHTGDLGKIDGRGYIYVVDRKNDMIKSGGENIYPKEIEHVLHAMPEVLECAVVGVPDDTWGEVVKAYIVLKKGKMLTANAVMDHCVRNLAGFKKPRIVEFVQELPKNAAGKILKYLLKN
jgi:long-chain acyl-CoA synthetase